MEQRKILVITAAVIALVAIFILIPMAVISSLNVLFPALAIPLTFKTWAAAFFLIALFWNLIHEKL